ncbi:MAG: ferritin family protein [Thermoanaerobaculia bacterium]
MGTIDFASLSLQDALDLAILIENEAAERYQELADQMEKHHTAAAARFFEQMVVYETKHRDELTARRRELFGDAAPHVDGSMLWEVEAPEYDKVRAFMTERQALLVALESEEKAHQFFIDALPSVADAEAKKLFEELRDEEVVHRNLVQSALDATPADSETDDALVDDPVAQ